MIEWTIEEQTGYKPITTFYSDFSIADAYGSNAVEDTYKRAFAEWKSDYKYLTELVMVLNWKIWEWYEKSDILCNLYHVLWSQADEYACEHLKGKELEYFYRVTD